MIQNRILLFFKKAFIAFPFLLGTFCGVFPQMAFSAAIETSQFDIDPFPLHPVVSGALYLDVTKKGACDLFDVNFNVISINPDTLQILILTHTATFSGGNDHCHSQFQITDSLMSSGDYQITVLENHDFGAPSPIGSFIVTATPTPPIPTLSEWVLILMTLLVLFFATREIQKNNVQKIKEYKND